jgi:hypothetical protein
VDYSLQATLSSHAVQLLELQELAQDARDGLFLDDAEVGDLRRDVLELSVGEASEER